MNSIIFYCWFSPMGGNELGLVITRNGVGEEKAYIGPCKGVSPKMDAVIIGKTGAKFPLEAAQIVMKEKGLKCKIYYE